MSLSFTILVCLYVSAYKNSSPCTDFHGVSYLGNLPKFINVLVFVHWNNNCHISEDLYENLSSHLALFGQEIALHKSYRVE